MKEKGYVPNTKLKKADHIKKEHPYIVEYEKLEENIKEYDRRAVYIIPKVLKELNLEVYRL